jgi:predicted membrane protein
MNTSLNLKKALPFVLGIFAITLVSYKTVADEFRYVQNLTTQNIKSLKAEIQINAGRLNLSAHNQQKIDFESVYTKTTWKPEFTSNMKVAEGTLSIIQPEEKNTNMKDKDRNEWTVKLPQAVPTNLKLTMGAGEGNVDLQGAQLDRLTMEAGAGDFKVNLANTSVQKLNVSAGVGALSLNLSGKRSNDLKANISGGIGELKLILPRSTGVRVQVSGLGSVDNKGFKKQGGYYVNEAYGKSDHTVDVDVSAGLGSVELSMKD